jgi:hypothetical protein
MTKEKRNVKKGGQRGPAATTPLRAALEPKSHLVPLVKDGIQAVEKGHRDYFEEAIRTDFGDSLEFDEAMLEEFPDDNRWDYLLGHTPTGRLIGVEPHSAKQDEVSTVIKKRKAAGEHLKGHLKEGKHVHAWIWVASGTVHFLDIDKQSLRLADAGIKFAGKQVTAKLLAKV